MPTNGTQLPQANTVTVRPGDAREKKARAKAPRKATAAPRKTSAAKPAAADEILFADAPNPNQTPKPPYIWIDHPQEKERLLGPVYVVRLGVGGATRVEMSVDGGAWRPCRATSGYWWFDWSAISPGKHTLTARMQTTDGQWLKTPIRACDYRL